MSSFSHRAKRATAVVDTLDAEGNHYPEFTHSLAIPAGLRAAPWSLPMGFSIIHQCLHYSLYLLAPGKGSLSWVAQGQYTTNSLLVDTGKVLSPKCCLWGDMHLVWQAPSLDGRKPSAPRGNTYTKDEGVLRWKFCPSNKTCYVDILALFQSDPGFKADSRHLYVKS